MQELMALVVSLFSCTPQTITDHQLYMNTSWKPQENMVYHAE